MTESVSVRGANHAASAGHRRRQSAQRYAELKRTFSCGVPVRSLQLTRKSPGEIHRRRSCRFNCVAWLDTTLIE